MQGNPYHLFESKILQLVLSLILGLVAQEYWAYSIYLINGLSLIISIFIVFIPFKIRIKSLFKSLFFYSLSFTIGTLLMHHYHLRMQYHLPLQTQQLKLLQVEKVSKKGIRYLGMVDSQPVLVHWKGAPINELPVEISGDFKIQAIRNFSPDFDYEKFNYWKGIKYQINVFKDQEIKIKAITPHWAWRYRRALIKRITKEVREPRKLGFIKSLILGDKSELDTQIRDQFQEAGLIHVLAISGLHLGIFIWLIQLIVARWPKHLIGLNLLSLFIQLSCLWFFVYLSGGSTSVTRAALMFSLLVLSQHFQWQLITGDFLALSALIILFFQPNQLFQLGFQLSYLAVFGILFYYPLLSFNLSQKNSIKAKALYGIWNFMAVGFAAQSILWPLLFYYFGQIPYYFWFYNLMIIPLITILLYLLIPLCFGLVFTIIGHHLLQYSMYLIDLIFDLISYFSLSYSGHWIWQANLASNILLSFTMLTIPVLFKTKKMMSLPSILLMSIIILIIYSDLQAISN